MHVACSDHLCEAGRRKVGGSSSIAARAGAAKKPPRDARNAEVAGRVIRKRTFVNRSASATYTYRVESTARKDPTLTQLTNSLLALTLRCGCVTLGVARLEVVPPVKGYNFNDHDEMCKVKVEAKKLIQEVNRPTNHAGPPMP